MPRCLRCQRMNPNGAHYCYFDGTALGPATLPPNQFALPWTFQNRKTAQTIDDFVRGCLEDWTNAKHALIRREFQPFFQSIRRDDLAKLVPPAEPDSDVALQQFLERLHPSISVKPAIDVIPRRLHLANLTRNKLRTAMVQILNRGRGLLLGQASLIDHVKWLTITTLKIKTLKEQTLELQVDPKLLPGSGSFLAKVKIETNGGILEVPIQADITDAGIPFQNHTVLDQIDLAKLMLQHPKKAVEWMHQGLVQDLFIEQGWHFPIDGPLAPQLGAVQQYFDAYRLSTIPKVDLVEPFMETTCEFPERTARYATLVTSAKKWIYATATSDHYWLKPLEPIVSGPKQVEVPFEIDSSLLQAGRVYDGVLNITVNGGVVLPLMVRADIRKPYEPWTRKIFKPFTG